ncbi:MAG: TIGR01244 family sulfur transferase [Marinibacterium sp.]|nr:TIGR01244 family sulfur transferase [Marinibacterium sp.]
MDMRQLTPDYFVSPQITPEDLEAAKAAGITRVICNRPDAEIPPHLHHAEMAKAAAAAGLEFEVLELTHQTMTPDNVARQHALIGGASGPVLAYCASGTRCSVVWALGAVSTEGVDGVLETAARAGYQLDGLRPTLEQIAAQAG